MPTDHDKEREGDEAFLVVWREWREGKTRQECKEMINFMIRNRSPWCADIARRELEDLLGKTTD
jgi:hypothetical protein